jgi:hypothetical protein
VARNATPEQQRREHDRDAEARFLLLCTREPEDVDASELRDVVAGIDDWFWTVRTSCRHGLAGLVAAAVARHSLELPEAASTLLRETVLEDAARRLSLETRLEEVLADLDSAGVSAIVIKGPSVARTLYSSRRLRPFTDIDLVVTRRDLAIAADVLAGRGYEERSYAAEAARRAHAGDAGSGGDFHLVFVAPDGNTFELHAEPLQLGLPPACEAGRWLRSRPLPGLDNALMLCPEDQLIQLATHVHKHGFSRLIWLKDIDLLCRRFDLDWDLVAEAAGAEGVRASVWYSLTLARLLLLTPLPRRAEQRLRPSLPERALYRALWPARRIASLQGFMRRRSVQFHAAESWSGMLPSLVVMGRRADRLRALFRGLRPRPRPQSLQASAPKASGQAIRQP